MNELNNQKDNKKRLDLLKFLRGKAKTMKDMQNGMNDSEVQHNLAISNTYDKIFESFQELLKEKNPGLSVKRIGGFEELPEKYREGKYVARADKQTGPVYILEVNEDFELPYEVYMEKDLICNSWRNNGFSGGMPKNFDEELRAKVPVDFDVIRIQGEPLSVQEHANVAKMSLYVVGGSAKELPLEKKL